MKSKLIDVAPRFVQSMASGLMTSGMSAALACAVRQLIFHAQHLEGESVDWNFQEEHQENENYIQGALGRDKEKFIEAKMRAFSGGYLVDLSIKGFGYVLATSNGEWRLA